MYGNFPGQPDKAADDERVQSSSGGLQLSKKDIFGVVLYVCTWPQRQCMCCYRDIKNLERINNIIQAILGTVIRHIQTLPEDCAKEKLREEAKKKSEDKSKDEEKSEDAKEESTKDGDSVTNEESSTNEENEEEIWTIEEKDRLLQFTAKIFLMNFPSYMAYKHFIHTSLEELPQHEAGALNNYCEITDADVPLHLLRNVCYFCDSTGIQAMQQCFEKGTQETLPCTVAHTLITIIHNLRLWMNIPTIMQYIMPLRTAVIRYMCKLSDKDLRVAGTCNMIDLMCAAIKEPIDTHFSFDKEALDLAFKYFTCSTLTIRLAGVAHINNQINLCNDSCNTETNVDIDSSGHKLVQWLLENNIIGHIFGPNLHVEIIKQSQTILNFAAVESCITDDHIDCIWAASQMKHCSKQVYDILIPLIKNLDHKPVQHLLNHLSGLDPASHTESTLYLASALTKCMWNSYMVTQLASLHHQHHHMDEDTAPGVDNNEGDNEGEGSDSGASGSPTCSQQSEKSKSILTEKKPKNDIKTDESPPISQRKKIQLTVRRGAGGKRVIQTRKHVVASKRVHEQIDVSESDIDFSDTSDEDLSPGSLKRKRGNLPDHIKSGLIVKAGGEIHGDESDVESADEELIKHAKLIEMGMWNSEEETSDLEEDEEDDEEDEEDVGCVHGHGMVRKGVVQGHNAHVHNQHLLLQVAKLALRRKRVQQLRAQQKHRGLTKSEDVEVIDDIECDEDCENIPARGAMSDPGNTSMESHDSDHACHLHRSESDDNIAAILAASREDDEPEVFDVRDFQAAHHGHVCHVSHGNVTPEDRSSNCSQISTKSEKNMADFEGEDIMSDDELASINAHIHFPSHQMAHLANLASMYQSRTHGSTIHHRPNSTELKVPSSTESIFDDVCSAGNTLIWDLVQQHNARLLPEGLAQEAEKALCTLVCFSTDRRIRMKFIQACIENVANHRSVVISLRLLPKIFNSFQQFHANVDTQTITMWAEKDLHMMKHFFDDLVHYTSTDHSQSDQLFSHKEEVQVRLIFLTCVFSSLESPASFLPRLSNDDDRGRGISIQEADLSQDQVDKLWSCLAQDAQCSDECLSWLLKQANSQDNHAIKPETFKYIFTEKMPGLSSQSMTMIGLNLFTQLSRLTRAITVAQGGETDSSTQMCGMDQLWSIALEAEISDVSMSAIQFLNNYYINHGNGCLSKEEEFVKRIMSRLMSALSDLHKEPRSELLVIQRGLILLKSHVELFQSRYAFHLRTWQIQGKGIRSHQSLVQENLAGVIRIALQPAGVIDKSYLEMSSTDLVTELRAEITHWWESLPTHPQRPHPLPSPGGTLLSPILGAMLGDGPVRMITQGQELTVDLDDKTLAELHFKDMQLVLVSVGASRPPRKVDGAIPSCHLPMPNRDSLPMMLLLEEPHFDDLLKLLEELSNLKFSEGSMDTSDISNHQTKASVLSRKVWELLMMLPTSPKIMQGFKSLVSPDGGENVQVDWNKLLDPSGPHKLMYSLQIVEAMSPRHRHKSHLFNTEAPGVNAFGDSKEHQPDIKDFDKEFIANGGLCHLFQVFKCGTLQVQEAGQWNQWNQECLAYLLRLISQFSMQQSDIGILQYDPSDFFDTPRKRMKHQSHERIVIPQLSEDILSMLEADVVLKIMMKILYDAAVPGDTQQIHSGSWGRTEDILLKYPTISYIVRYALSFFMSWAHCSPDVLPALSSTPTLSDWLKRLLIQAPEAHIRREVCTGLYKLCLGGTSEDKTSGYKYLLPILSSLLVFISDALLIQPERNEHKAWEQGENTKEIEPYGPGCRDYFWLLCRLVEGISDVDVISQVEGTVNLDELATKITQLFTDRAILETRYGYEEDDSLLGLLSLFTSVMKHNTAFKDSDKGQEFLVDVYWSLFALPSQSKRDLPKCKSQATRSAAYDCLVEMVKGSVDNYQLLHSHMLKQHTKDAHSPYPWDYWPQEDGRSKCGYVGLTNLGATCYMATCMQHLYMIPQARQSLLSATLQCPEKALYEGTLGELKKMFAYLLESERKSYNPKNFCKVYTMDKQPLNTGEQKDMTEFFTDLITKLEEMSHDLKELVKTLFGGVITNNVVSLDCPHVSRTVEEFYTVRCQVTDMKNLYESLDEVTVKDMLEGDNMYTCSKCQKKVRAEKRACLKKLPKILCFNTMRYTFNMITMMKEKVNTHFSFPLRLDMTQYMEKHLMGPDKLRDAEDSFGDSPDSSEDETFEYELIGVTVHTGTADGGHYYSFIRDRLNKSDSGQDKWYLFNDAEVKPFDPSQISVECFGGEMTSKTYDSVTDKFMDFSFEKTNSAYMLFYEKMSPEKVQEAQQEVTPDPSTQKFNFELPLELGEWIWQDNMQFLKDKNTFDHTYFWFLWQLCGIVPSTLLTHNHAHTSLLSSQLSVSFVLETLIHAKEKPHMLQWIELLTKQFNSCHDACEWFLDYMATDDWWPQQILIKCPNQTVRQMFQRLLIHVINQIRTTQVVLYLHPFTDQDEDELDLSLLGNQSCVTRFIKKMLSIIEHGVRPHGKYLTEYFAFLCEFAKMGDEECLFLIHSNAITTMVSFYMGQKAQENYIEIVSDDEESEDDVVSMLKDKYRPLALEKMIHLIAFLTEKSRGPDHSLRLSDSDYASIAGGKGFPFLMNQIRDNINIRQTCNLIFSLSRWNDSLAIAVVQIVYAAIRKLNIDQSQPFFKLLSMLVEFTAEPPGLPAFTQFVLHRFWEITEHCPQQCLEWLSTQVLRNKHIHTYVLKQLDSWVEPYLLGHTNNRVRNAAAHLLICLVPSSHFRQAFRSARTILSPHKELLITPEALSILHQIYEHLLSLLARTKHHLEASNTTAKLTAYFSLLTYCLIPLNVIHISSTEAPNTTAKLTAYFSLLSYCLISKKEKLMFSRYFIDLWNLFHPKLSEPNISTLHNKQSLLLFWYQVCVDCGENIKLIVTNQHICKNIAFNYILADHEDQEVVMYNRSMLPSYYGLLRMCCQFSRNFTRQLAHHQNMQWAFENLTPYPAQYTAAVDELFKMMRQMAIKHEDSSDEDLRSIAQFRSNTIHMYLQKLDARSHWQTLVTALKILVETHDECLDVVRRGGLQMMAEAFNTLHAIFHEATACHVAGDMVDLLSLIIPAIKVARSSIDKKEASAASCDVKSTLNTWKEKTEFIRKLLMLLNSYVSPDIRNLSIGYFLERTSTHSCSEQWGMPPMPLRGDPVDVLKEMALTFHTECMGTMVPILSQAHTTFQDQNVPLNFGPYFPRRGQKPLASKTNLRPPRPQFQMFLHANQLESAKGLDPEYDQAIQNYYNPYHILVDLICRVAVNQKLLTEPIINLSAMVAYEGVPLHTPYFAKLWYEIYCSEQLSKDCIHALCASTSFIDYVDAVLLDERPSLNNGNIYQFFLNYFPKVHQQVLSDQSTSFMDSLLTSMIWANSSLGGCRTEGERQHVYTKLNADLRAMMLIFSLRVPKMISTSLTESLASLQEMCKELQQERWEELVSMEVCEPVATKYHHPHDTAVGETPSKRRRTDSTDDHDTVSDPQPGTSRDTCKPDDITEEKNNDNDDTTVASTTEQQSGTNSDKTADKTDHSNDGKCVDSVENTVEVESTETETESKSDDNPQQEQTSESSETIEPGTSSKPVVDKTVIDNPKDKCTNITPKKTETKTEQCSPPISSVHHANKPIVSSTKSTTKTTSTSLSKGCKPTAKEKASPLDTIVKNFETIFNYIKKANKSRANSPS